MQKKSYKKASSKFQKYIIVADESVRHGLNYSFFFGGCIVKEDLYENISNELDAYKDKLGLNEIKREKINRISRTLADKVFFLFSNGILVLSQAFHNFCFLVYANAGDDF